MYRLGEIVTLNVNKTEGAGDNSMTIMAGITGMVANAGNACGAGNYSYVVDFGPEGQWNCYHNELTCLNAARAEEDDWDEDDAEELEQDLREEETRQPDRNPEPFESDGPGLAPRSDVFYEPVSIEGIPETKNNTRKPRKKISFEDDLARMVKKAEEN